MSYPSRVANRAGLALRFALGATGTFLVLVSPVVTVLLTGAGQMAGTTIDRTRGEGTDLLGDVVPGPLQLVSRPATDRVVRGRADCAQFRLQAGPGRTIATGPPPSPLVTAVERREAGATLAPDRSPAAEPSRQLAEGRVGAVIVGPESHRRLVDRCFGRLLGRHEREAGGVTGGRLGRSP